ncbi:MAG: trimeric intracellular cation channel family protein [Clostridia bacterium]|nr:trimeric intracellular cation channel family protein [Clostridia bacterium]
MELVLDIINIVGIISFAAAGAMIAIDKETDLFGVIFLSLITCFGGGMLRDMLAGQAIGRVMPIFFTDLKMEIIVCVLTAFAVFLIAFVLKDKYVKEEATVEKINNVLDALGLGVFASVGTGAYIALGPFVAIVMGLISSVGGSIIRDVILRDIPFVLRKRVYAVACIVGSGVYYIIVAVFMKGMASADIVGTISCMAVIFAIRMCATVFRWNMPKAIDFSKIKAAEQSNKMQ